MTAKRPMHMRLNSMFKKIDLFGEEINFRVEGEEKYQTCCGSLVSIAMLPVIVFYAAIKF